MKYDEVVNIGRQRFSEFENEYQRQLKENILDPDSGVYIVFEYAFDPIVIDAVNRKDKKLCKRLFDFIEEIMTCEDDEVGALGDFGIMEVLVDNLPKDSFYKYLGPESRHSFAVVSTYLNADVVAKQKRKKDTIK